MRNDNAQEAELKNKAGTAWSHSYLNQKPWHPLSYPNQKKKWIAEQTHQQRQRRAEDVHREFAQEQEFLQQTAMMSKKEREKAEAMQGLSFMYLRPPGYNAESARAAELADEKKKFGLTGDDPAPTFVERRVEEVQMEKNIKPRVRDIYGRPVPTEEEFPALKNAPRLQTGTIARAKPFGVEIRNVKCARCGNFGHQSGDRECSMKDTIMPNEEARLKRDDPLNALIAITKNNKWELKQQIGGMSPPRGGFKSDDANQQIIAEDDVYDEYGGFLAGDGFAETIAEELRKSKKKREEKKHRKRRSKHRSKKRARDESDASSSDDDDDENDDKHRSKKRSKDGDSSDEDAKKKHRSRRRSTAGDDESSGADEKHQHRSKRRGYGSSDERNASKFEDRSYQGKKRGKTDADGGKTDGDTPRERVKDEHRSNQRSTRLDNDRNNRERSKRDDDRRSKHDDDRRSKRETDRGSTHDDDRMRERSKSENRNRERYKP